MSGYRFKKASGSTIPILVFVFFSFYRLHQIFHSTKVIRKFFKCLELGLPPLMKGNMHIFKNEKRGCLKLFLYSLKKEEIWFILKNEHETIHPQRLPIVMNIILVIQKTGKL